MMTIVAKIEIMEERQVRARVMGHDDVAEYYGREIAKLEKEQEQRKLFDALVRDKLRK